MNDIIKVEEREGRELVNARELHKALEVTTRFNDWIARRIETYGFIEGKDFYSDLSKTPDNGRPAIECFLTVQSAKELATVENNDKGREVRRYLLQVEEAWNTPEMVMLRGMQAAAELNKRLREKIVMLEPKAQFFDQVADSKTALQMRDVAAALNEPGWGRNKIFAMLREYGVLDERNIPYRQYQDSGYFRVVEQSWTDAGGETHVNLKTLVYQKGVNYIRSLIKKQTGGAA
jgi:anti-repressor protein